MHVRVDPYRPPLSAAPRLSLSVHRSDRNPPVPNPLVARDPSPRSQPFPPPQPTSTLRPISTRWGSEAHAEGGPPSSGALS
eukprot:61246-Prorocentrum_minimum.AAC.1